MNQDRFKGKWNELKGKIKEKWGKLTDNDIMEINGKYEQFLGALQKRYGYEKERAEKEFNSWNWGAEKNLKNEKNREKPNQPDRNEGGFNRVESGDFNDQGTSKGPDREQEKNDRDEENRNKKRKAG